MRAASFARRGTITVGRRSVCLRCPTTLLWLAAGDSEAGTERRLCALNSRRVVEKKERNTGDKKQTNEAER
ncbi:hypothetical protein F2P81_018131 [Scophthalmus maximus]|uniref:Uncharacterized protein n=1 Tax=Scophthalmus maximus TaxID=52904 RepID=A0A6A4S1C8_SCOMX|nr:hypothetical protein F2P81_018131 [Scophthalmus maximus]